MSRLTTTNCLRSAQRESINCRAKGEVVQRAIVRRQILASAREGSGAVTREQYVLAEVEEILYQEPPMHASSHDSGLLPGLCSIRRPRWPVNAASCSCSQLTEQQECIC